MEPQPYKMCLPEDMVTGYIYSIAVLGKSKKCILSEMALPRVVEELEFEMAREGLFDKGSEAVHSDLFSLLFVGLFDTHFIFEINKVFNSGMHDISRGSIEPIDYKFSGVLRFSFLESLLAIECHISQPSEYKQLFSSVISATYSAFLCNSKEFGPHGPNELNARMQSSCSKILPQARQKACLLLGPVEVHRFMYYWASKLGTGFCHYLERQQYLGRVIFSCYSEMQISYNSNIGGFWKITSYSPLFLMETTRGSPMTEGFLHRILNHHLLHCIFQFRNVVRFCPDWIEVCLEMDNVRCDVIPLERPFQDKFQNERHFPTKICLTIGPQNGCVVHSVSLDKSSQNPMTDIGKGNTYEVTFEPPKNVGFKAAVATTYTDKIKNWGFEQSVVEDKDAEICWTLYDSATGKAVFDSTGPPKFSAFGPKTWSIDRYSKASRAFTEKGGVVFAKDEYGSPIIWRLNRDLEGQTLKWVVQGSVWLTYRPNTHRTRYWETKRHDFCQELDLTLVQPSGPAPT